jgi:hypothetical protein
MRIKKYLKKALVPILASFMVCSIVLASLSPVYSPNFFKKSGNNINFVNTAYELCSSSARCAKIWATAIDSTSAIITTITGALDLNGGKLTLDANGNTSIQADTDDQIDIEISAADDFQFVANIFRALSGSVIETNTINETTGAAGVTIDGGVLIKDNGIQTGSATLDTAAITMIKGAQTSDPQVQFALTSDGVGGFSITTANGSNGDITFTPSGGETILTTDLTVSGGDIVLGTSSIFSGGDTASLNNVDALDATTEATIEAAIDTLGAVGFTGAVTMTVDDNDNYVPLTITQNDVTNNPRASSFVNAGTGNTGYFDHNGATGTAVRIESAADGGGVAGNGVLGIVHTNTNGNAVHVYRNQVTTRNDSADDLVFLFEDNPSAATYTLHSRNDGTGKNIFLDTNNIGDSIDIDANANSASDMTGLNVNVNNAGAGENIGINLELGSLVYTPSSDQSLSAGSTIPTKNGITRVVGNGGAVTLTSTPHIADASDGTIIIIQGTNDTNTLTLQDEAQLANSGMQLPGGADCTLGAGDTITLMYDSGDDNWIGLSGCNNN